MGIGVVVGLALVVVAVTAALMFVSAHDAFTLGLLLAFAGLLAARSAMLLVVEGEADRDAVEAARRDLLAAVSHDLRTPLAALRVLTEAIAEDVVDDSDRRRYARQLGVHVDSLGHLIDDLFELSRLEAGQVEWSVQRVRVDELVEETVEAMLPHAEARGVVAEVALPPDLAPARANPEQVQRVLFNLIQNAIRHTPADGTVTVLAEATGEEIEVEVADSGEGIAPAEREAAFQPFYRGGSEASRTRSGAGLGLTICRAIVEAHGGRIWLPESDRGTRVRFSLPAATGW
jgi:signal transduction histidine kinase